MCEREREGEREKPDGCQDSEETRAGLLVLASRGEQQQRRRTVVVAAAAVVAAPSLSSGVACTKIGEQAALVPVMRARQAPGVFITARRSSVLVAEEAQGKGKGDEEEEDGEET